MENNSELTFCPKGGQGGILCKSKYQKLLAQAIEAKFMDLYIPIPSMTIEDQATLIKYTAVTDSFDNAEYWENERGEHGWCDKATGKVIQWG